MRPLLPVYQDLLRNSLDGEWVTEVDGIWLHARPAREYELPAQGFKIHVSATVLNAEVILERVIPRCIDARCPFKVARDPFVLDYLNSKRCSRGSSGKFITVYPSDVEAFKDLIERLHLATLSLKGPYILSDRRYKTSSVVFYRYGGFRRLQGINVDGTHRYLISGPGGDVILDERQAHYSLPSWVEDPFPATPGSRAAPNTEESPARARLNERFEVVRALSFSNVGGVYEAVDCTTGASVILKEARPLTNYWRGDRLGMDAVGMLEREYALLCRLEDNPSVPRPIALFAEWEHTFLAEEYCPGATLGQHIASGDLCLTDALQDNEQLAGFLGRFRSLSRQLLDAIGSIHQCGVILGDISPNNILLDAGSLRVTIIDLEGAFWVNEDSDVEAFASRLFTPGFRQGTAVATGKMPFQDDYAALGMVLFSMLLPVGALFELRPGLHVAFLARLAEVGLPPSEGAIVGHLLAGQVHSARQIVEQWS